MVLLVERNFGQSLDPAQGLLIAAFSSETSPPLDEADWGAAYLRIHLHYYNSFQCTEVLALDPGCMRSWAALWSIVYRIRRTRWLLVVMARQLWWRYFVHSCFSDDRTELVRRVDDLWVYFPKRLRGPLREYRL